MNVTHAQVAHPQPGVTSQAVDNIWTIFAHNLNSGASSYIEMPINLKSVLGDKGLDIIASRFRQVSDNHQSNFN